MNRILVGLAVVALVLGCEKKKSQPAEELVPSKVSTTAQPKTNQAVAPAAPWRRRTPRLWRAMAPPKTPCRCRGLPK